MKTRFTSNLLFGIAAAAFLAAPAIADEPAAAPAGPEVKFSGEVEFDAYTGDVINEDINQHQYPDVSDHDAAHTG